MSGTVAYWSHAFASAIFVALVAWRLADGARQPGQRLLLAALALTACWAWLSAIGAGAPLVGYAETARNLIWIALLHSLTPAEESRQHGIRLVYGAVAAVLGFQFVADTIFAMVDSGASEETAILLRITAAAGALVLVHNVYGQASPSSRSHIRMAMLALALIWTYDLNYYTIVWLDAATATGLGDWRGLAVALAGPLFALGSRRDDGWGIRLSRAATFQSLSLLAICGYFAVMTIVATALRGTGWDWLESLLVMLLALMTVATMVLLPSARARSWAKVKLAKHLFEHRYDYRTEWLRFTDTLGHAGPDAPPLGERAIKAFADILEAPGGLLLTADQTGEITVSASWNWASAPSAPPDLDIDRAFWGALETGAHILELDASRHGWGKRDLDAKIPDWMIADDRAWVAIPLIHHDRQVGLVLLAAPDYRRPLDWEDFDLLRTAGRQAASSLAEAHGQEELSNARRFEEFNRRFAFILHDIKNLVSQLSLLSRNAERHADNPEFRADMVATLKGSVGKMNDLLARLSPQSQMRLQRPEPHPLRPILVAAIAAKRRDHEVRLLGHAELWAMVDAGALEQAVSHLLQNAVDASPTAEPVIVRVADQGSEVSIAFVDKGAGMDGDFLRNQLFQPFASTKTDGFGIGSFEARSLIAAMGGRLTVDSRPGQGTSFTIFLPAAQQPSQAERISA